ncbi:phosphate-binding protein PstS [Longispora fulva]|uniref:Phosphate-binding protein n=1 Tax=Longispora fulva TaxID=619741 RepID=A0A8J7KYZ4_9ACTN|nr:phosphate ABC transporter substrate-binding protein PstS [Longispora fulva]MBG6139877.1 phosphate transport system substrate-binding protein [Longispora fulva]GIG57738.1 phosphate-binding protein PstS [Longispora fulva]
MKLQRLGMIAGVGLTATLALTACGSDNTPAPGASGSAAPAKIECASGSLAVAGSSAQKNAMAEWIKNYTTACPAGKIEYNGNGSGAGIQGFTAKTADFAGSDSALKDTEQGPADARCATGKAVNLPMVTGPIAIVFKVDGVDNLSLKPATIAGIFGGKITKWNDPAIAADNAGAKLPETAIQAVHRSDSSGTTDNFTGYLTDTAKDAWTFGKAKEWKAPGGVGSKGSDGVAADVAKTTGSIGYVELSFAETSGLKIAKVYNASGAAVALTPEAAAATVASAKIAGTGDDLKLKIDYNTTEAKAYPLVLVTYEIVCTAGNTDKAPLIKSFLTYTSSKDGQAVLTKLGYAPLDESVRAKVAAVAAKIAA